MYDIFSPNTIYFVQSSVSSIGYNPESRYSSYASYIGKMHLLFDEAMDTTTETTDEAILMFGGDIDLPHNNYLEDLWILALEKLTFTKRYLLYYRTHSEPCRDLLFPSKTALHPWDWTCGSLAHVNTSKPCRWEDVVRKAWCLGQYQDFVSPL